MAKKKDKAAESEAMRRIIDYLPKTKKSGKTYSEIQENCMTSNVHEDEFYITGAEIGAAMKKLEKSCKLESEFRDREGARFYWKAKEDEK